jgi:2-isopropylmalate synthase
MGLLAGAQRVEGTLFGNGERTGNTDLITLALNMYSQGINPLLDFSDIPSVVNVYERLTGMEVHPRHPYCGELVFAAFSGSHQDAIAKGMKYREENESDVWNTPYLPIDPTDLGRQYDCDVIRINSQSGKGGVGYILSRFDLDLPVKMREAVGYCVKSLSDKQQSELSPDEVYNAFKEEFVNVEKPLKVIKIDYNKETGQTNVILEIKNKKHEIMGVGNGQLDALSDAFQKELNIKFDITNFSQHAMENGSKSQAVSYIEITDGNGSVHWGAGLHTDIGKSARAALVSSINRSGLV